MIYFALICLNQTYRAVFKNEIQEHEIGNCGSHSPEIGYSQEIHEALKIFRPINQDDQEVQAINVTGLIKVNTWKLSEAVLYGISSTYIDENQIPISQSLNASIPYFAYYILSDSVPRSSVGSVGSESTICP
jgi:hypothetical protein